MHFTKSLVSLVLLGGSVLGVAIPDNATSEDSAIAQMNLAAKQAIKNLEMGRDLANIDIEVLRLPDGFKGSHILEPMAHKNIKGAEVTTERAGKLICETSDASPPYTNVVALGNRMVKLGDKWCCAKQGTCKEIGTEGGFSMIGEPKAGAGICDYKSTKPGPGNLCVRCKWTGYGVLKINDQCPKRKTSTPTLRVGGKLRWTKLEVMAYSINTWP